ncbi:SCO3242 family prenyltransferase [Streptomyces sp. NPDC046939]|uniref:SCO3242 family prenyltransferase n=1 Tax=Streptomyces sp. NPDC046939 TaxID=3155376 RepID=UPI0033FC500E
MSAARDWADLLRVSALCTAPGDALAGAAAAGLRPGGCTALAAGASMCLYGAGMALNDWADREEDAVDRPHRPLPSGRITSGQALAAAVALTAAGVGLALAAGRPAGLTAATLAGTAWAYDLRLKHTPAGPAAMAATRALDLLLGAIATTGSPAHAGRRGPAVRRALLPAAALGAHTLSVTAVSRTETRGGAPGTALVALGATAVISVLVARGPASSTAGTSRALARSGLAGVYAATAGVPLLHAALNPSPPLSQRAVSGGIRAVIPLQAALTARSGPLTAAALLTALAPVARRLARKVSPT